MKKILVACALMMAAGVGTSNTALAGMCEAIHTEATNSCGGSQSCQAIADREFFDCLRRQVQFDQ